MRQDDTGTTAGIGTFTPAGGNGFSVASELSGLLQSNPEYRNVLDLYAPQYEGRNGIYGAIGSFGATLDPAIMSQRFPTQEAARAAAQQLMAGVTPDKFSAAIVQGAPQYMSQFKDSSEMDDFFGMHTNDVVRGILGVIGGGAASGMGASAAGAGAAAGGFSSAAMGGNVQDVLRSTATGALTGAAAGAIGDYIGGAGTVDPYGPSSGWGQDTFSNMQLNPTDAVGAGPDLNWGGTTDPSGIGSLTDGVDPNAFDRWYNTGDINYGGDPINTTPGGPAAPTGGLNGNPVDDYITRRGASDGSVPSGNGGFADAGYGDREVLGQYDGTVPGITPGAPTQTVPINGARIPPTTTTAPPSGLPSLSVVPNIPTGTNPPVSDIKVPDVPEYRMPDQAAPKTDLEKFWDWAKANPKLAMQLFGLGASAFGGGNSNNPGAGGPGTGPQAGMTSTPAAPLNRHYVAPPPGYRPGFDPEWQYFQPGPTPASQQGGTSTTQPVQGRSGIASVSNAPTFTSGSSIGSPIVTQPYTPGPNNNMDMNGQPLTPTFSGVGAGGPPPANVPQQAGPTFTPQQTALADAYRTHLGLPGTGGTSSQDMIERLATEARQYDMFGNDSTSVFKNNQAAFNAYKSGDAAAMAAAFGTPLNNASAAYRYTGDAASAAAGQAELDKLNAQKAAAIAATQLGGPMFGGVGALPKP